MKFMRRPDIDTVARVHIAAQAFLGLGVYGASTRLAKSYRVSRLFVYTLLWQLMLLYALAMGAPGSPEAIRKAHRSLIFEVHFQELEVYFVKNKGLPMLFLTQCGQMTI